MEVFLKIVDNKILDLHTECIGDEYEKYEIKDMQDFYKKFGKYTPKEEIENKIEELLNNDREPETVSSYNIKHWVSNRSFGELIDMYLCGEIKKPDMQREFVWDSLKCSRLIESIILGLPIPPLFLLEVGKNQYEVIDGFQRITTFVNYVSGNPWYFKEGLKRKIPSKLSKSVSKEIEGRTFEQLDPEYQKMIKRSTIPLIEFRQLEPDNYSSKYLIFERINTGSEKLNPMQIRKSLAHGEFINSLFERANSNPQFKALFSLGNIKRDLHVEAFLRVIAMSAIIFDNFKISKPGICNILNEYCEINRQHSITEEFIDRFDKAIQRVYAIFETPNQIFRRVEKKGNEYVFSGNLNISIMEAFLGTLLHCETNKNEEQILCAYKKIMYEKGSLKENPFTVSTGIELSIRKRFEICQDILRS